jgi:3-hydroxyisobutyrate dehydrogenase-like beta-hydroxyacid dehydrogenase
MEIIGFVGLGTIGGAVARNIHKAGYPMMVHDIRSEAVQQLVELGARPAGSVSELGRHYRVVFSSPSRAHGK